MNIFKIIRRTLPMLAMIFAGALFVSSCDKEDNEPAPPAKEPTETVKPLNLIDFRYEVVKEHRNGYDLSPDFKIVFDYSVRTGILSVDLSPISMPDVWDPIVSKVIDDGDAISILSAFCAGWLHDSYPPAYRLQWSIYVGDKDFSKIKIHRPSNTLTADSFKLYPYRNEWLDFDIDLSEDFHFVYNPGEDAILLNPDK